MVHDVNLRAYSLLLLLLFLFLLSLLFPCAPYSALAISPISRLSLYTYDMYKYICPIIYTRLAAKAVHVLILKAWTGDWLLDLLQKLQAEVGPFLMLCYTIGTRMMVECFDGFQWHISRDRLITGNCKLEVSYMRPIG